MLSRQGFAGSFPFDPLTLPALLVHDHGTGSGCFLQLSNSVYLLTARHVIFAEPTGTNPPALLSGCAIVKTYSGVGDTNISERAMALNLSQLFDAGDLRYATNRDIALIRVEDCNPTNRSQFRVLPGVMFLTPATGLMTPPGDQIVRLFKDVEVGADVFMFGYPTSLTVPTSAGCDPNRPLLRKGIVAGVNPSGQTIILDAPSYGGNSGGPVLEVEHLDVSVTGFRIIGLVRAFVPFQEEWENKTLRYSHINVSNSGYTLVEPIDTAIDLAWK